MSDNILFVSISDTGRVCAAKTLRELMRYVENTFLTGSYTTFKFNTTQQTIVRIERINLEDKQSSDFIRKIPSL